MREQQFGAFERTIRLPSLVKADAPNAEFNNGILTMALPKTEEAKERRIPVRGTQQAARSEDVLIEGSNRGQRPESSQDSMSTNAEG